MLYFKAPGQCLRRDFVAAWGDFVRNMEVSDDQYAIRQVEEFDNGNVLRYDRGTGAMSSDDCLDCASAENQSGPLTSQARS
jgi:hypothetical protein